MELGYCLEEGFISLEGGEVWQCILDNKKGGGSVVITPYKVWALNS